ncbi:UNVERIFIED_CONTAM: hypothetical protein K2H54_060603 [Gekko kuhli]
MKKILFLGVSTLLCWVVAQSIWCKECQSGNTKHCFYKNDVCKSRHGLCYTYVGYLGMKGRDKGLESGADNCPPQRDIWPSGALDGELALASSGFGLLVLFGKG